ncbi:E3 ubiquitin-protein ligase RNF217 [Pholidichthys leucotaenia]
MGRAKSGMENEDPVGDAGKMPSFISSLEEGRAKLSRSPPIETPCEDSKVERPPGDVNRRVSRSNSGVSVRGGARGAQEEDVDEGNNNNNCNGGRPRWSESVVEVLRRSFRESKSPSMQGSSSREGSVISEDCAREHADYGDALHVHCTVYCIADDGRRGSVENVHRQDDLDTADSGEANFDYGRDAGSSPEPAPYTVEDLVDPFGDMSHQLHGERADAESCRVCLEEKGIVPLPCCRKALCDGCLRLYVSSQVRVGKAHIRCPMFICRGNLEEGLVISHLTNEEVSKYRYFLELSQLDSSTKPCPQCSHFTSLKMHNANRSEHKYKIQCSNCQFVWCFKCHAPWHNGIKCRDYRKGDKLLRTWASVIEHGQRNAQKCPQCKIHIQRTEGCDHMTCTQCNTNFCYRCGERYRHLRFFGDHTSNLSVFGCKYRYLPDKPHLRRLIRGSVCATKVLIAPVVILLVLVLGTLALVIGVFVFPVYYVCKRRKKQQRTRGSGRWI